MNSASATRASLLTAMVVGGAAILPAATAHAAPGQITSTLVRTTDTSAWPHPSPDPSGITYNSRTGQLIISDGEVEERGTAYPKHVWKGTNLFVTSLRGAQVATGLNTTAYSNEPTGVGFRPGGNSNFPERLFVTDDDQARLFEVTAGDGVYGNAGDTQTSTSVAFLNLGPRNDAEDVAVDLDLTRDGRLLLVDGKGKRVFLFNPGPDRVFNGTGDFVEKTIDVGNMGAGDPEGIAYHAGRDTFFVLDDPSNRLYEVSLTGELLNFVSLPVKMKSGAGLAFAPPSGGGGGQNAYIVDRGVDNDTNQDTFNDGKLYEIAIPGLGDGTTPPPDSTNTAPVVDAGPGSTVERPNAARLDGTVTDDGKVNATPTTTWSMASGPGTVTFENAGSVDTTATFSAAGSYVLRLTANDGGLSSSDTTTITVTDPTSPPPSGSGVLDIPVRAGADDAEERTNSGSVGLGSGDLNLGQEDSYPTATGMRFENVTVPAGATITRAYVTFTADEIKTAGSNLTIAAQASDNPPAFTTASRNITSRPKTGAQVAWAPAGWPTVGAKHQSADIKSVLQEIVDRGDWASGESVVLLISGVGERAAESYEGGSAKAPVLHIEYS